MVEKDLSLLKQELEEIKKETSGPRSPTRSVFLSYNILLQYTAISYGCENDSFQMTTLHKNRNCGYTLEPPH